jgi:ABC-type glycerol-3-phosphate transport system substrate-binding protein
VDEKTGRANFTHPKFREAVAFYVSLRKCEPPGAQNFTSGESVAQFTNGKVAFIHEYLAYFRQISNPEISKIAAEKNLGWAVKPIYRRLGSGINGVWIGVYSRSKNKEAAVEFVKYLMSPGPMRQNAIDQYIPPGRLSVLRHPEIRSKLPMLEATIPVLETGYLTDPKTVKYAELREIIGEALSLVFTGQKSLDDAFDAAQKKADKVTGHR